MSWTLLKFCIFWICASSSTSASNYEGYPFGDYGYESRGDQGSCKSIDGSANKVGFIEYHTNGTVSRQCWEITNKENVFITFRFLDIRIPSDYISRTCAPFNGLLITDYYGFSKTFCGFNQPPPFSLYRDEFQLDLRLNSKYLYYNLFPNQDQNFGFRLQYQISYPHQNVTVNQYSFITFPGFPDNIFADLLISWNISLASNSTAKSLQFSFNDPSLQTGVLEIYDGPDSSYPRLYPVTIHRPYLLHTLSSSGPHLYIKIQAKNSRLDLGFNATVKAKGYCLPGTFSCGDKENCFADGQRCDSVKDCPATAADEKGCNGCSRDQVWCGGYGQPKCIPQSQLCDGKFDCPNNSDDLNCDSCSSNAFFCNQSNSCISQKWRCDGQRDCANGEDEIGCNAKYQDITIRNYRFITSPNYPKWPPPNLLTTWNISLAGSNLPIQLVLNVWKVDSSAFLEVFDGSSATDSPRIARLHNYDSVTTHSVVATSSGPHMVIQFYVSNYNYPRYISYRGFNATVKVKGYCLPGSSPCGDGENCFSDLQKCDQKRDCPVTGADEKGCGHCGPDEFYCGPDPRNYRVKACYTQAQRCNGNNDCYPTKNDEINCDSCAPGAFFCKWSNRCIYEKWRCDGQEDCKDNEDELDCSYPASRKVITAAIVGSLVCGLLLAIALGCTCKLYTLRIAPNSRNRRNRTSPTTPLSRIARELLQREAPPSYSMTVDGVENSEHSSRRHSSSRRHRERRRRRRNREPRIRRAQPSRRESEASSATQDSNRDDVVSNAQSSSSRPVCTTSATSVSEIDPTPEISMSVPATTSSSVEVACVLAEIGLTEFSSDSSELQQINSSAPPADTSPGPSQPDAEPQASPLPKKRPIPPVMVEAPFNTVMVDDIPSCVYPNPPTYHEATITSEPPSPDITPAEPNDSDGDQATKATSATKEVLNKIWTKRSPKKVKKFLNFPLFQVFNIGKTNSGFHELRETTEAVHLDDDQVQLISDFVSDDIETGSTGSQESRLINLSLEQDGPSVFELQSYSTPNLDSATGNELSNPPESSVLVEISPTQPQLDSSDLTYKK